MRLIHCLKHINSNFRTFTVRYNLSYTALTLKDRLILLSSIIRSFYSLRAKRLLCSFNFTFRTIHALSYIQNCSGLFAIRNCISKLFLSKLRSRYFIVYSVHNIHSFELICDLVSNLELSGESLLASDWVLPSFCRLIDSYQCLQLVLCLLFIALTSISSILGFVIVSWSLRIQLSWILVSLYSPFDWKLLFDPLIHISTSYPSL